MPSLRYRPDKYVVTCSSSSSCCSSISSSINISRAQFSAENFAISRRPDRKILQLTVAKLTKF